MIFQESDQDDDCSHSILISEEGDPRVMDKTGNPGQKVSIFCPDVFTKTILIIGFSPNFSHA